LAELHKPVTLRNVILVGGSQGSIPVIKTVLSALPADFRAAICITIHRGRMFQTALASLLGKTCALPIADAKHGELFRPGRVYLAPPDHHLVLRSGAVWLDHGPKHHHARPAVDPMFFSGASAYGSRVIGVLVTGNLSDGVAGLIAIKRRGGLSLVQDPHEAEAPSMPQSAVAFDDVDAIFPVATGSALLRDLVRGVAIGEAVAKDGAAIPHKRANGTS
jgi:two-component system chemotaxis response regulator CheB